MMGFKQLEVVQIVLSNSHPKFDICDRYANQDAYGLGPGLYPKEKAPLPPYHPHCRCLIRPRLDLSADKAEFDPKAASDYLKSLDDWTAAQVAGSQAKRDEILKGVDADELYNAGRLEEYQVRGLGEVVDAGNANLALADKMIARSGVGGVGSVVDQSGAKLDVGIIKVNILSSEIGSDKEDRKAFRDFVLQILRDKYQGNPKTAIARNGDVISVSWSGIKHAMNAGLPTWQESAAALHIEYFIEQSDLLEIRPDKRNRTDPRSTALYQAAADFDGVSHKVIIFVRNHSDGNRYYDHVTTKEKAPQG